MLEIEIPGEWDKAGWKNTTPGNYQNHIGEITEDGSREVMVWVYGDVGRFGVKVGTSTRLDDSRHYETNIETEQEAKLKAVEFMREYATKEDALDYINPY